MGSRSKMQGTPWHYENHWEANITCGVKSYEYPYQYKQCYFENSRICQNSNSKYCNQPCEGFVLCMDFSLSGIPKDKKQKQKKKNKK